MVNQGKVITGASQDMSQRGLTKRFFRYSDARLLIPVNVINSSLNTIIGFTSSQ